MREILFRAKAINRDTGYHRTKYKNGEWVYGLITKPYYEDFPTIPMEMRNTDGIDGIDVDYKTVGQFTGLTDKNGKKIFEGDILQPPCWHTKCNLNCVCIYAEEHTTASIQGFALYHKINDCVELVQSDEWDEFEVIGNIHDNPEFLGE